jgi:hypothetical protein
MGTIFWTHRDSGGMQFNYSEIVGYYADNRNACDSVSNLECAVGCALSIFYLLESWVRASMKGFAAAGVSVPPSTISLLLDAFP